ncbi:insulinase family protein [Novosphingobium sp. 1949]|uniref:Insulinase family protein n=1 Tax=Novosphingobium organovorum TaxID=2930092 RepID=A0ABT0BGQ9_9SPHN|nr:pitrilysin family protein [Novosphingobium organovorum]MCJ2183944.1 insulinase family protein [Novosphingobium organovorum]
MRIGTCSSLAALATALLLTTTAPALARADDAALKSPAQGAAPAPASPEQLVAKVDIPYETFQLANGLTTIVHTDRKAPIVGVTLYYKVGSKNEPRGHTGFAHLYEHLFFSGSANVPNFDIPLEAAGSTPSNGSTWFDRTNYVETVPTGALDLALFVESDRMGYLLPAVTQDRLDQQRGVVQNEKRQGDNQPYGLTEYALNDGLLPVGHPYRHTTIGSMADLDAATLTDVRQWFTDHYGPNNVVLVLSGDIDATTARAKVEKWFGQIPRGPAIAPVTAGPVTLAKPVSRDMTDQVPMLRLTRAWTGPGLNDPDTAALEIGMHVLGGLASSRLDNALVRGQQLAVGVTASDEPYEQLSMLSMAMMVKPGVDRTKAETAFDGVLTRYLKEGPSADELQRAVVSTLSREIGALERVGGFAGKGATLAEGMVYSNDPAHYKKRLEEMAALTPEKVRTVMNKWLSRPVFKLAVVPGERTEDGGSMGGWGDEASHPAPAPDPKAPAPALAPAPKRAEPALAPIGALQFPTIEHARLSNGVEVTLARRTAVPKLQLAIDFDAGTSADTLDTPGTQALMLDMLDEGTTTRNATQIAEAQERLGAEIETGARTDTSSVTLVALSDNLAPSLALMADVLLHPAFAPGEVARVKASRQAQLAQALSSPNSLAQRTLTTALFGTHPYAQPSDGLGNAAALAALTPADLKAAHDKWLRPDLARITVVGDVSMEQLKPMLEKAFAGWTNPASPAPVKHLDAPTPAAAARILLVDRPNSPQSVIMAGRVLPMDGTAQGNEALDLANDVLGGGFLSRLNADIREDKGWSYGVYSGVTENEGPRALIVRAPVQADRTGDSIKAILADMAALPASKPVSAEELQRVTEGAIRGLPNQFETNAALEGAIARNARLKRPENYYETLASTYRGIDARTIGAAARTYLQPGGLTFVVVGDRKVVEAQLKDLGLPVEVMPAPASGGPGADEQE